MSGLTASNGVESDQELLLSLDAEADEGLHGNGTSISALSQAIQNQQRPITNKEIGHSVKTKEYVLYLERWYVLAVFSLMSFIQCLAWNTWGPIEDTGLRIAVLLTGGLLVIGVGVRCIPVPVHMMKWTMNIGHIFIGLAGPIMMSAVTSISATWFPTNERTTATAISSTLPYLGLATSFVLGPEIVGNIKNGTTTPPPFTVPEGNISFQYNHTDDDMERHLKGIHILMYIEFGAAALVYLAALIRFPARPLTPPTASAIAKREDMIAGLKAIVKNVSFWIPALAYAISSGAYNGWTAQMVAIFNDHVDQTTCGWIGCYTNLAALFGGIAIGRCADYFTGKMKAILLVLIIASCATLTWSILLANDYIPYNLTCLYVSVILFGLFLNSTIPLFMEITVESAFPIGEETTTILMTWLNNLFALCFLILPMIPSIDKDFDWLNWVMLGSTIICIPLMIFFKEHYNRLDFDVSHPTQDNDSPNNHHTQGNQINGDIYA
ncbi:solute carrier family 49 member 4 homolog isoform X2 [Lytechinus pictus]|uniref:solute carrier family 49 member 4 homolog isoform X2 n=1 Tax=Lytechinus pictus TaxID=7653 RepID=UPI0030B9D62D